MPKNTKFQEDLVLVATIDPDAYSTGEQLSDAIDMSLYESIAAIVLLGDIASTGTVDAKLQASATSGGTYADITGRAATQLTQAGTDSDKQVIINLRADEMPAGKRYVKLSVTMGTAGADMGAVVIGRNARYGPGTGSDLSTVDEYI